MPFEQSHDIPVGGLVWFLRNSRGLSRLNRVREMPARHYTTVPLAARFALAATNNLNKIF